MNYGKIHSWSYNIIYEQINLKNKIRIFDFLLFCGKVYPIIYHIDELLEKIKNNPNKIIDIEYTIHHALIISKLFDICSKTEFKNIDEIHKKCNSPIIYISNHYSDIPYLISIKFIKVMSPFDMAKNSYMYLNSVLAEPEKEILVISDKDKIIKHGFDSKISFINRKN